MTEALPFQTQQPIFSKMGGISELSHMDSEERRKYFSSLNKYRTNLSVMQNEHEEGVTEGHNEKAFEIARLMLQGGESIEKIGNDIHIDRSRH